MDRPWRLRVIEGVGQLPLTDGAEPDQIIRNRRMPKAASVALKVLAGAVMGIALMMVLYLVIALTHLA